MKRRQIVVTTDGPKGWWYVRHVLKAPQTATGSPLVVTPEEFDLISEVVKVRPGDVHLIDITGVPS